MKGPKNHKMPLKLYHLLKYYSWKLRFTISTNKKCLIQNSEIIAGQEICNKGSWVWKRVSWWSPSLVLIQRKQKKIKRELESSLLYSSETFRLPEPIISPCQWFQFKKRRTVT